MDPTLLNQSHDFWGPSSFSECWGSTTALHPMSVTILISAAAFAINSCRCTDAELSLIPHVFVAIAGEVQLSMGSKTKSKVQIILQHIRLLFEWIN